MGTRLPQTAKFGTPTASYCERKTGATPTKTRLTVERRWPNAVGALRATPAIELIFRACTGDSHLAHLLPAQRRQYRMHPRYKTLFTAMDQYVRAHHQCFLAELSPSQNEWVICIRPINENTRVLVRDVYACKYFRLSLGEAEEVCSANSLGSKLRERIDRELRPIGDPLPG